MNFILIIAGSILAIIFLMVVARHFGSASDAVLESPAKTKEIFKKDYPKFNTKKAVVSLDKKAAVLFEGENIGLVVCHGDSTVTRLIKPHDLATLFQNDSENQLTLKLQDLTLPTVTLKLSGSDLSKTYESLDHWHTSGAN